MLINNPLSPNDLGVGVLLLIMFKIKAPYKPAGDQPKAIKQLIKGLNKGHHFQTLLGVTGSGKTFTMANVIAAYNKPTLVIAPNKALAAQLYREYKTFFPEMKFVISFLIMTIINPKPIFLLPIHIFPKKLLLMKRSIAFAIKPLPLCLKKEMLLWSLRFLAFIILACQLIISHQLFI